MIPRSAIRTAATAFWTAAGGRHAFGTPVDLEGAAVRSLPVAFHRVPNLNTTAVTEVLARFGIDAFGTGPSRFLRGCLVADVGVGIVLIDSSDPVEEQRLTVAHEVAHFLLHYMAPRQRAISLFGPNVIPVLGRIRRVSRSELFASALRGVPIMPYRHAMVRDAERPTGVAAVMEAEADELALELLAPHDLVRSLPADPDALAFRFGIPRHAASRLVEGQVGVVTTIGVEGLFGIR